MPHFRRLVESSSSAISICYVNIKRNSKASYIFNIHRITAGSFGQFLHGDVYVVGGEKPVIKKPVQVFAGTAVHRVEIIPWNRVLTMPVIHISMQRFFEFFF